VPPERVKRRREPRGLGAFELVKVAEVGSEPVDVQGFEMDGAIYRQVPNDARFLAAMAMSKRQVDPSAVPAELKCPLTKKLIHDPVVLPCCGFSVSVEVVMKALSGGTDSEAEGGTCVFCHTTGVQVDALIPNRQMREAIAVFFEDVKHAQADACEARSGSGRGAAAGSDVHAPTGSSGGVGWGAVPRFVH